MKKSRFSLFIVLVCFGFISTLFAGALIDLFQARSDGENIILTWETQKETNVKEYVLLRGTDQNNLSDLAIIPAKGSNSTYTYVDESAYKSNDAFYIYQLKIVDNDFKVSYSGFVSVDHNVSSVKRTWGSIKALFR